MTERERGHEHAPEPATTEAEMKERIAHWLPKDVTNVAQQQEIIVEKIAESGDHLFAKPETRATAFTNFLNDLSKREYTDAATMLADIARAASDFVNAHFTKESLQRERRQIRREAAEANGLKWLNDAISYGTGDRLVHVHVADLLDVSETSRALLMRQGLRALATVVAADPTVETVLATSWLVADPRTARGIEAAGFRIVGPISDEERAAHFVNETRPVARAIMTREEFLKKWGQKTPAT